RKLVDQNIPPGVVVDSNVTHPAFKEFYLNSHITLQGSAITPRYTVLVDDLNFSMDELEGITYMLTYAHQIVNLSTSIPTPLYVAHSYAERGRNNHEQIAGSNVDVVATSDSIGMCRTIYCFMLSRKSSKGQPPDGLAPFNGASGLGLRCTAMGFIPPIGTPKLRWNPAFPSRSPVMGEQYQDPPPSVSNRSRGGKSFDPQGPRRLVAMITWGRLARRTSGHHSR
uniref:Piwi domain-containing protein n=1 Tax=Angiostrongylus cantonensis TaxID=6313 RepID=A0A0K0DFI0_ANGCA